MNQPTPIHQYVYTFPKDEKGNDVKYRFMLTLSKRLGHKVGGEPLMHRVTNTLGKIDGVDSMQIYGGYTIEMTIARTFDPDVVIAEISRIVTEEILSDIIKPKLIVT